MKVKLKLEVKLKVIFECQMFDVHHLNIVECQIDVKLFDIGYSNVECQNDMNVKCQTVLCSTFKC